jgi:hypothetical protein
VEALYRWDNIAANTLCYPTLANCTPRHSHWIITRDRNALNYERKFFLSITKNRLADPSEICALEFKEEF